MITLNGYFNSFVVAVLVGSNFWSVSCPAANDGFRFALHPPSIEAGERATLELRLPKLESSRFTPKVDDSLFVQATPFTLLHSESKEETGDFVWLYDITSYKTGDYTLPPIQVQYGPNTYSTERVPLTITSSRPADDESLRDDFPKLWPPLPWRKILTFVSALFFFGAAIPFIYRRLQKIPWHKLQQKVQTSLAGPPIDPLVWLKRELTQLRSKAEREAFNEALVDDLTFILRKYLHLKYQEPFQSRTTLEFKHALQRYQALSPLLDPFQKLDGFKFAPVKKGEPNQLVLSGIQVAEKTLCGT